MRGILTMARLTAVEMLRRRVAAAALAVGLAFLLLFSVGFYFINQDIMAQTRTYGPPKAAVMAALSFVVMAGLYAANFLAMMASAIIALDTLAGEISSGVIETLCTKPVRRSAVFLGKWLGCASLVVAYVLFLMGGVLLSGRLIAHSVPPGLLVGLPLIVLEALLLMTLALAAGTRTSALASGMVVFGLHSLAFVGARIEQISTLLGKSAVRTVGIIASLVMPSEALWLRASFLMQPPIVRDMTMSPFAVASVPSPLMVVWAVTFIVVALALALRTFSKRDL